MCTTDDEVFRLRSMFCEIKYIVFEIKILTVLLLCPSFGNLKRYCKNLKQIYKNRKRSKWNHTRGKKSNPEKSDKPKKSNENQRPITL